MTTNDRPQLFPYPANSGEFTTALAHYYRAEIQRAISWRDRLDRTTNWAIAASAAILSVSLNEPQRHHGALLFGMAVVFLLLVIEARRYRYFDLYSRRVRAFETGYYAHLMNPGKISPDATWLRELGHSVAAPALALTLHEAMAHRLRRNYCWIFLILLAAWLLKVLGSVDPTDLWEGPSALPVHAAIGWTPGWAVLLFVLGFHAWLGYVMVRHGRATRGGALRGV